MTRETMPGDNVIKLELAGGRTSINTLLDKKNGTSMSLLCPFPMLDVHLPVTVRTKEGETRKATVHRIGVEEDPETGLPKLRLSVRTAAEAEDRWTIARDPEPELVSRSVPTGQLEAVRTATDSEEKALLDGLLTDIPEKATEELLVLEDGDMPESTAQDPAWVRGAAFVPVDPAVEKRSRRRRLVAAVGAWVVLAAVVGAAGWAAYRAGAFSVQWNQPTDPAAEGDALGALVAESERAEAAKAVDAVAPAQAAVAAVETAAKDDGQETSAAAAGVQEADATAAQEAQADQTAEANAKADAQQEAAAQEAEAVAAIEDVISTEITLPTRWPAEYTTAYRLHDPNGVVVDVPGGLVKREGWLTVDPDDAIIRSVKAIQRENGARFIVYVKGGLPNFRTTVQPEGVKLSIYYKQETRNPDTQKVARL